MKIVTWYNLQKKSCFVGITQNSNIGMHSIKNDYFEGATF